MHNITEVVNDYIDAWNEPDGERRRALTAAVWTEDGTYLDPLMRGEGHDGIAAMIGAAQAQFPGHRFEILRPRRPQRRRAVRLDARGRQRPGGARHRLRHRRRRRPPPLRHRLPRNLKG